MIVNVKPNFRPLQKAFVALGAKQVPFATALALTALAKGVAAEEAKNVDQTFDSPTPFTERSFRIESATKSKPLAIVAIKDIQAQYLAPYIVGGERSLGKKQGMLVPRSVGLNQYGNIPRNRIAALRGKPGVFIGPIRTKAGKVINGVWQRSGPVRSGRAKKGDAKPVGKLKLLVQFEDTTPAPKHFAYFERARTYLKKNAAREMDIAMRRALATAR